MVKEILVDSSIIIDFLRVKDKSKTTLYHLLKKKYSLSISILTHTELYGGRSIWENTKRQKDLEFVLSRFVIKPLTLSISKHAGQLQAVYGTDIIDAIIAATALEEKLPLATLNVKDFRRIKKIKLLKTL